MQVRYYDLGENRTVVHIHYHLAVYIALEV